MQFLQSLHPLLQRKQAAPVVTVLSQRPRKRTAKPLLYDDLRKLSRNDLGRVPGPKDARVSIPIPFTAVGAVVIGVGERLSERVLGGNSLAAAVSCLTARSAVGGGGAAGRSVSTCLGLFLCRIENLPVPVLATAVVRRASIVSPGAA